MKIVVGLNVLREKADRVDINALCASITNGLRADGIALAYPVKAQNNALSGTVASLTAPILGARSVLKVGVSLPDAQIDARKMRNVTARCLNGIMHSTGYLSQVTEALNALPPNGSGDGSIHTLVGEPRGVSRVVSGGTDEPFLGTSNTTHQSTVINTNGTGQQPGDESPSGIDNAARRTRDTLQEFLNDAKTPAIAVGVTVGIVAIAVIVWKVA